MAVKCVTCGTRQPLVQDAFRAGWLRVTAGDGKTVTWYCQMHHPKPAPRPPRAPFQTPLSSNAQRSSKR